MEALTQSQVRALGSFDSASRWYPAPEIAEYFRSIRSPSRAWPYSYYKAAFTKKFAKWLKENHLALYVEIKGDK